MAKQASPNIDNQEPNAALPVWLTPEGAPVSCVEKIKVLNENILEIREMCQEALEDAVLMGCDEKQIRDVLMRLIRTLEEPFKD